ncbi:hypothetical protein [Nonomuraea dietziae]|uniref:hypothetical protein n=1 Tax=Nonomuraea dietziae TaxID=65515 RepID=UPI003416E381
MNRSDRELTQDTCISQHVSPLIDTYVPIDWAIATPRADRVRVRAHTCERLPVAYELCQAAGLMFIRRTSRGEGATVVHESPWQRVCEVEELWRRLLEGMAR